METFRMAYTSTPFRFSSAGAGHCIAGLELPGQHAADPVVRNAVMVLGRKAIAGAQAIGREVGQE